MTGSVSLNNVNNDPLANFCKSLNPKYKLPSVVYMSNTIIPLLYRETQQKVKDILTKVNYISMTAHVWTSFSKQKYLSITAIDN